MAEQMIDYQLQQIITSSVGPTRLNAQNVPIPKPDKLYIEKFYAERLMPALGTQETTVEETQVSFGGVQARIEKVYTGGLLGASRIEIGQSDLPRGGKNTLVFLKLDRADVLPIVNEYKAGVGK